MENYQQFKARQQKELDALPMRFAFSDRQLDEALQSLGATKEDVFSLGGGCIIRKTDSDLISKTFDRFSAERQEAYKNADFLVEAIEYELGNHEYCITRDTADTVRALDLNLKDEHVAKCLNIAVKQYRTKENERE